MTYRSVIRNFANIGMPQAEKLREELSLSMPVEMLKICGKYYKNQLRRDPFVDELKMLDMLISVREQEGTSLALTEFFTNDAFVARTYADLLKKRKELWPEVSHPCTLGEAANVAGEYIRRAKGENKRPHLSPSIENVCDSITYPDATCVSTRNSAYRMRLLPQKQTEVLEADTLILMTAAGDDTQTVFRRKSAALLRNKELMKYVKGVSTVGCGGILRELLKITDGVLVQLSSLSPIGTSTPATALCEGFKGCRILRVAPQQSNIVTTLLTQGGVRALPFAFIKREPKFVFARDNRTTFVLDAHFLRSLNKYKSACAKLSDEAQLSPDTIAFGGIGGGNCAYLHQHAQKQLGEVIQINSNACVAASASPTVAPYKTALWSVLSTIASLCACGIPYTEQTLSLALEIPKDLTAPETVGNCMATLLGLYRAQTELGLFSNGRVPIRSNETLDTPCVSVWALAESHKAPKSVFSKSGNFVYALSPALDKNGLPDFVALRQMLTQIAKFANEEKISACRVLAGESITDGIRKMSHTLTCVLAENTIAFEGKLPLCILIESEQALPLSCIGKVRPCNCAPRETIAIPKHTDLIACDKPEIVIVSSLRDNNAMALAALLEARGAHVSFFALSKENEPAISRAILTTQTLILCSNMKLPETAQMQFALDTLKRAGGILLSLSKNSVPEGFISLKNGIDEEILQKICL